jgi:hypothetical protein
MRILASLAVLVLAFTALPAAAQSYSQSTPQYGASQQYSQSGRPGFDRDRDRRRQRGLHITGAYYGVDGRTCEATRPVSRSCEGKSSCTVRATNRLCGDPAQNVVKVLTVSYDCHGRSRSMTRREGSHLGLRCE